MIRTEGDVHVLDTSTLRSGDSKWITWFNRMIIPGSFALIGLGVWAGYGQNWLGACLVSVLGVASLLIALKREFASPLEFRLLPTELHVSRRASMMNKGLEKAFLLDQIGSYSVVMTSASQYVWPSVSIRLYDNNGNRIGHFQESGDNRDYVQDFQLLFERAAIPPKDGPKEL